MAAFVNTAELKNQTNRILRRARRGPIVVTRRGHPCAVLIATNEKNFEDLLWGLSPRVTAKLARRMREIGKGHSIPFRNVFKRYNRTSRSR